MARPPRPSRGPTPASTARAACAPWGAWISQVWPFAPGNGPAGLLQTPGGRKAGNLPPAGAALHQRIDDSTPSRGQTSQPHGPMRLIERYLFSQLLAPTLLAVLA